MSNRRQFFDIKFPFVCENEDALFIDLNNNINEKVNSEIAHVILTPKGRRLRMPEFGTDLIKYIFEPSDNISWEGVENEIKNSVKNYVKNVEITKVDVLQNEGDDNAVYIDVKYTLKRGITDENNRMVIKL
jgi:phage baseplate assembly protein W